MERKRYDSIDTFKALGAFFVVCLHTTLPNSLMAIKVMARIAVPFFFMVSGFFSYTKEEDFQATRGKRGKKILNYVLIILGVIIVYSLANMVLYDMSFHKIIRKLTKPMFLIANFGLAAHMWFVRALIYLEISVLLFHKIIYSKNFKYFLFFIWILDVIVFKYSFFFMDFKVPVLGNEFVTKYLGTGLLYYFIGWEYRRNEENIRRKFSEKANLLWMLLGIFCVLNLAEWYVLEHYLVNKMPVNYLFTFFVVNTLFIALICNSNLGRGTIVNFIGSKLSMYIYYWHLIIRYVMGILSKKVPVPKMVLMNSFTIFLLALIMAYFIYKIKSVYLNGKQAVHGSP